MLVGSRKETKEGKVDVFWWDEAEDGGVFLQADSTERRNGTWTWVRGGRC